MEWLDFLGRLTPLISSLTGLLGLAVGWIASARKSRSERERDIAERQRALSDGMLALMRGHLMDAYERHVTHGAPLTVARRECIDREHAAYKALGGNSTGDLMYEAICELPTHVVGGGEES